MDLDQPDRALFARTKMKHDNIKLFTLPLESRLNVAKEEQVLSTTEESKRLQRMLLT